MELIRNQLNELILTNPTHQELKIKLNGIVVAQGNEELLSLEEADGHPIFEVEGNHQTRFMRERHLWKTGVVNFRDLGGYPTKRGSRVKYGCFFRSAAFIGLSDENHHVIDCLSLKTNLDLRSNQEVMQAPDASITGCDYLQISGIPMFDDASFQGNLNLEELAKSGDVSLIMNHMDSIYESLPIHNEAYHRMFELIENGDIPLVFHCSAGKDRTGVGAMLILLALGCERQTVIDDYLLSNDCRAQENERIFNQGQQVSAMFKELMEVQQHSIEISLQSILNHYDSFENYFLQEYGLDAKRLEALRNRYCEE